ncbi:hypothetical protein HJFPF1_12118 [Paramyrothecium foliicola]|nr:hypothetical protein HJFPF1_12118 [Paramyrothecium foliicola]
MASISNFYANSDYVFRGGWTNWNEDSASSGQITMLKEYAELLSIFIGIFLVFIAAGLWTSISYTCFQWNRRRHVTLRKREQQAGQRASDHYDGLYHQMQTVLRNGGNDINIGLAFLKLWLAWGRKPAVTVRTLPIVTLSLLSFFFFLVALPFITALLLLDGQGIEVLIKSPNCGFWLPDLGGDSMGGSTAMLNQSLEAISYVDSCYEGSAKSALCDAFLTSRRLPVVTVHNVECPFDKSVCLPRYEGDNRPAIMFKTGALDSHKHFGINSPLEGRLKLQRTTTCSPLNVTKFSRETEGSFPSEVITGVYLGPSVLNSYNYTYGVSNLQIAAKASYNLECLNSRIGNGTAYSALFEPISELQRDDADISVIFLNNNHIPVAGMDGPCKDPFFSATKRPLEILEGYYWADSPVTAIGCIDQYELGNAVSGEWTRPMSYSDATSNNTFIKGLSKRQTAAFSTFTWGLGQTGIDHVVQVLGTSALRAMKYPGVGIEGQNPLPNDQWKAEVEYWFLIGLAKLQLATVNVALGPNDPTVPGITDYTPYVVSGRDDILDIVCSSQKIFNLEFKNLHRAGFITLAVLGGLCIIVPSLVTRFIIWRWKNSREVLSWIAYGQLQLQRMAAEGAGVPGWVNAGEDVPILAPLDLPAGIFALSLCVLIGCRTSRESNYALVNWPRETVGLVLGEECFNGVGPLLPDVYKLGMAGSCRITGGEVICQSSGLPSLNLANLVLADLASFNTTDIPSTALEVCMAAIDKPVNHGAAAKLGICLLVFLIISIIINFVSFFLAAATGSIFSIPAFALQAFDALMIFAAICLYIAMINFEGGPYLQGIHASEYSDKAMLGLAFWFMLAMLTARLISNPFLIVLGLCVILPIILVILFVLIRVRGLWFIIRVAQAAREDGS